MSPGRVGVGAYAARGEVSSSPVQASLGSVECRPMLRVKPPAGVATPSSSER